MPVGWGFCTDAPQNRFGYLILIFFNRHIRLNLVIPFIDDQITVAVCVISPCFCCFLRFLQRAVVTDQPVIIRVVEQFVAFIVSEVKRIVVFVRISLSQFQSRCDPCFCKRSSQCGSGFRCDHSDHQASCFHTELGSGKRCYAASRDETHCRNAPGIRNCHEHVRRWRQDRTAAYGRDR